MIKKLVKMFPVFLLSVILACASAGRSYDTVPRTLVEVDNRGWLDVNVYLYHNGTRIQRLGTVTGHSHQRLYVRNSMAGELPFQLYTRQIGGREEYLSENIYIDSVSSYVLLQVEDVMYRTTFAIFPLRGLRDRK